MTKTEQKLVRAIVRAATKKDKEWLKELKMEEELKEKLLQNNK